MVGISEAIGCEERLRNNDVTMFVVIPCRYSFRAHLSSCEVSLSLCVSLRFVFTIVISFSLDAMLPLLANKDEYNASGGHS